MNKTMKGVALLSTALLVVPLSGCGPTKEKNVSQSGETRSASAAPPAETAEPETEVAAPSLSEISLSVKTKEKHCFGSAGCSVTFEIRMTHPLSAVPDGGCEVTYKITGLEDPYVGTFTIVDGDTYNITEDEFGSTPTSNSKLKAKATEVECEG